MDTRTSPLLMMPNLLIQEYEDLFLLLYRTRERIGCYKVVQYVLRLFG